MQITHIGHACLLVETSSARVLLDPGAFSHGFEELTELDAVVITHQHADHLDVERLPQLLEANDGARLLVEPETAAELTRAGIQAEALHPGQSVQLAGLRLTGVGGEHAMIHPDLPRIGNVGVVLQAAGEPTLFHPGDAVDTAPPGIDLLALPISAPWAAARDSVELARAVAPTTAFPIHDAVLSGLGRGVYLRIIGNLLPDGTRLQDLAGAGAVTF